MSLRREPNDKLSRNKTRQSAKIRLLLIDHPRKPYRDTPHSLGNTNVVRTLLNNSIRRTSFLDLGFADGRLTISGGKPRVKELHWIGSSLEDLKRFPEDVQGDLGQALWLVQCGQTPRCCKPLKGFGGGSVLEIIENFGSDAYRVVYTLRFKDSIYVLHCFMKKSKHGIATPPKELQLVKQRLCRAQEHHSASDR